MNTISIDDFQRDLLGCFNRVQAGESFLIMRDNHPIAKVTPVMKPNAGGKRPYGLAAGEFTVPADFDEPLPNA
jgi:antitoxin (DNA-binding transcriptional repressor) of toxin-antitoxin stability system